MMAEAIASNVPPGTIDETATWIVTGFKVSKNFFFNDQYTPNWVQAKLPHDRPWWERLDQQKRKLTGLHDRVFGSRLKPVDNVHLSDLFRTFAIEGFIPHSVTCKYASKGKVAIQIHWTRNRYRDTEKQADLSADVISLLHHLTGLFSWSVYGKQLTAPEGSRDIIINMSRPIQKLPSWRTNELYISEQKLIGIRGKPRPAM